MKTQNDGHSHKPGLLKQTNKGHKHGKHKSKGELHKIQKGKVEAKTISRKLKLSGRKEKKRRAMQVRNHKIGLSSKKKSLLGVNGAPPFLIAVIPVDGDSDQFEFAHQIKSFVENNEGSACFSSKSVLHAIYPRLKLRYSFVFPQSTNLYAQLDAAKAADTIVFLYSADKQNQVYNSRLNLAAMDDTAEIVLNAIMAQGLPTPTGVITGLEKVPQKLRANIKKEFKNKLDTKISSDNDVVVIERENDLAKFLHILGSQKQNSVKQRDVRSHILAENVDFYENVEKDSSVGTLEVSGYVRYQPLDVNGIVHLPGIGDFQLEKITVFEDPYSLNKRKSKDEMMEDQRVIEILIPDPQKQASLQSSIPVVEDGMDGDEDRNEHINFISEADEENEIISEDEETDSDVPSADEDSDSDIEAMSESGKVSDDDDLESTVPTTLDYDKHVNFADEKNEWARLKEAREDAMFPDEVDTPHETLARLRFQKYRGLASFKDSPWNAKEDLPFDYGRIYQFENFNRTRKRIYKLQREGVKPGSYVTIRVKDVPRDLIKPHVYDTYPLVIVGLLPHEHRMSVLNVVVKRVDSDSDKVIKSKDKLVFQCGFRRFIARPIFSQHSLGNKHKFEKFLKPGVHVVATCFAPITFAPSSVLVFERDSDGDELVAVGSVLDSNPDRIIVKRTVLSGHPFKVKKRHAVVRFMFYNKEDILWFKPLELHTKYGLRGHIREPLGTHGHMKCIFNKQIKSQDTVLLNLYKRVFPKWTYDPNVTLLNCENMEMND
ncbi:pre-rRNA-processing protein TSR1 homolog [Artemia franciscana]|uniref:Pre-rRNA-processing protein TSR1 homolog n=1 Tax=Artemia franciscana TaxID=6661 RepID=A0AA88IAA5_ARTSF|nr:hypothetical protein QYM36_001166 [Artemia franciscana]